MKIALAMNRLSLPLSATAAVVALLLCVPALASEKFILMQGDTVAITAADIRADALRIPPEMRSILLAKPQTVSQIATNLYVRRAMANQAEAEDLGKDPVVIAALQVARDKVLSDVWLAKIDKHAVPSDADAEGLARNIYKAKPERFNAPEQVQARHILIAGTTPEARKQAEKILEEIKTGADFAVLAQERSADKDSAVNGGDLGLFARGRMVPEFDKAVFALEKPGDLSGVVESQFGYHLIQLDARKPSGMKAFAEVRDELVNEVRSNLQQEARVTAAQKLQQDAKINTEAIEAFAAGYASSGTESSKNRSSKNGR